tara:strand:- start:673 stop:1002 length:330 start_codon:yes stop_codon:yes gene_type:complete
MPTIDVDKVSEGIDYKLVPVEDSPNDQAWDVRILRGEFVETVIRYGNVAFDGSRDCLTFNFMVIYTPDPDVTTETVALQEHCADILEDILATANAEGWLVAQERKDAGD